VPLSNATPYLVAELPQPDHCGVEVLIVVVKATYEQRADGRVVLAEEPEPVRFADEMEGDGTFASAKLPSDVMPHKPSADVIVVGSAIPPRPVEVFDVGVVVRGVARPLRVHGPRFFDARLGSVAIGKAAKFERTPLVYERAYGGVSEDLSVVESRNPAGVGVAKNPRDLDGKPAPQIEHPARPHLSAKDHHPPMGLAPLPMYWSPRREYFGNVEDRNYRELRMPLPPTDFDSRFYLQAHPSMAIDGYLEPGEVVAATGMAEAGTFRVTVPEHRIVVRARWDDRTDTLLPPIDTLVLWPDEQRFELLSRCALPLGRTRGHLLRDVQVDTA
jgi:hypothetical protein